MVILDERDGFLLWISGVFAGGAVGMFGQLMSPTEPDWFSFGACLAISVLLVVLLPRLKRFLNRAEDI